MTVLQALVGFHNRHFEPLRVSREQISFALEINRSGCPIRLIDLRIAEGAGLKPQTLVVPMAVRRTNGVRPNFLWDTTAYLFACSNSDPKRTAKKFDAFRALHLDRLKGETDAGLVAVRTMLEARASVDHLLADETLLDTKGVFRLEGDPCFVHEREAARRLISGLGETSGPIMSCLVTGELAPATPVHTAIKGLFGPSGADATLVSFNFEAACSYGKAQGANAPVSVSAVAAYARALNAMLEKGSRHRLRQPMGGATVVFFAEAPSENGGVASCAAEEAFAALLAAPDESDATRLVEDQLEDLSRGRAMAAGLQPAASVARFHVLGLSRTRTRVVVRFWLTDTFGVFAERLARHHADLALEPAPSGAGSLSLSAVLFRGATDDRIADISKRAAGLPHALERDVLTAVLAGRPYPARLLAHVVNLIKRGVNPASGWHVALIVAALRRAGQHQASTLHQKDVPMALDTANDDPAYLLGRLFAVIETAQVMVIANVNATVGDRGFKAALMMPASQFPSLMKRLQAYCGKLRRVGRGQTIEPLAQDIVSRLNGFPRALGLQAQGRFILGYYHQSHALRHPAER